MEKVIVIGCPGSGKSTFARRLRDLTGLPLFYLDQIWHKPDKTNVTADEFDSTLAKILQKDRWIVDGNYIRTLETRLKECDTVFFLDFPVAVCIQGVESRIGKRREDMPWIEEEFEEAFRQWILDFPKESRPRILDALERCRNEKTVFIFQTREEIQEYLSKEALIKAIEKG